MKYFLGITLILLISSPVFGQHIVKIEDAKAYPEKYVSSHCISFDHPMFTDNLNACTVDKFDSLFSTHDGDEWFLAEYSASGLLKSIQNDTTINLDSRSKVHHYPVFMLFKMTQGHLFQGRFAVSSDGDMEGASYDGVPVVGMSSYGPIFTTTLWYNPFAEEQFFYFLDENKWHEVESSSWEKNLSNYLLKGQFPSYELKINPGDLTVETYIFNRKWRGVGDYFEDAKKLGTAYIKLGLKNYHFFIKRYNFKPAR